MFRQTIKSAHACFLQQRAWNSGSTKLTGTKEREQTSVLRHSALLIWLVCTEVILIYDFQPNCNFFLSWVVRHWCFWPFLIVIKKTWYFICLCFRTYSEINISVNFVTFVLYYLGSFRHYCSKWGNYITEDNIFQEPPLQKRETKMCHFIWHGTNLRLMV